MTAAIYMPLGSVLSFPIEIRNTLGQLADPDAQSVLLFSNEVAQATPGEGVAIRKSEDGLFWADAASGTAGMEAFFAEGKRISAAVRNVEIDSESGFGGYLPRVYILGDPPSSTSIGQGTEIVTITVQNAANAAQKIQGIPVSAYASGVLADRRLSGALGTLSMHLNPGKHRLSAANPGLWQMDDPDQEIDVIEGGPNSFVVELNFMPITPPALGKAIGWILAIDEKGQPLAGVEAKVRFYRAPSEGANNGTGVAPPDTPWTVVSGANGMIEFGPTVDDVDAGLVGNWEYQIWGEAVGISEDEQAIFKVPMEAVDDPDGFPIRSFIRKVES